MSYSKRKMSELFIILVIIQWISQLSSKLITQVTKFIYESWIQNGSQQEFVTR